MILAAGNGTRLLVEGGRPKPLATVGGRALLDHILCHLEAVGFRRAVIVVGYQADAVRTHSYTTRSLEVEWIVNPTHHLPNGISLLSAREAFAGSFTLLMADHLFEPGTLRAFIQGAPPGGECTLAVDRKVDAVFDLADATKVVSVDNRVTRIGKQLDAFDGIDTGMFHCSPEVFAAMATAAERGDMTLSDGVAELAGRGEVHAWDAGDATWIDVDTPAAQQEAERLFERGCFRGAARDHR